ncbi:MAG: hypothetical protein WA902_08835 [Thermosynechococcaceae cyanobacterium]
MSEKTPIQQPLTPEQVSPEQKQAHQNADPSLAVNSGDVIDNTKNLEEKAQQVAVDAPDITGDHEVVPTYFVVDQPNGEQEALHHVKDAEEISDVIRQARVNEDGEREWR